MKKHLTNSAIFSIKINLKNINVLKSSFYKLDLYLEWKSEKNSKPITNTLKT